MVISKEDVFAKLHQLPSIPAVIQEIMASFTSEDIDREALAKLVASDQGLSAKVLRVANSPFYGLPRKIASIQDAILVMGFDGVRSLVLTAGFVQSFPATPGSPFNRNAYWKHGFRVAGYARTLAQLLQQNSPMAFSAGMFHEIGQMVLDICIPEQFAQALKEQESTGLDLISIEQARFGFDHALIGAKVAKLWNFPPEIEHAIRYWAIPDHQPFHAVTGIVHVAVLLESGLSGADLITRLPESVCTHLGLNWERIETGLPKTEELDAGAALLLVA